MKVNRNDLIEAIDMADRELSLFTTVAEADTLWNRIPNSELEIIKERVSLIRAAIGDLFNRVEPYQR